MSAGSRQLRVQDPAPLWQCGIEEKTGHHEREGANGNGNWDEGGDGNENKKENTNRYEDRDGGGNGSGNGDENREIGGRERERGNLRSDSRGRSEGVVEGATSTRNQKPWRQKPTPQQDRRIVLRTRA